jgi:hypothetical protein
MGILGEDGFELRPIARVERGDELVHGCLHLALRAERCLGGHGVSCRAGESRPAQSGESGSAKGGEWAAMGPTRQLDHHANCAGQAIWP